MATSFRSFGSLIPVFLVLLFILPSPAAAFGAGNIPGISSVEGINWRHGDIEDMLKTIAFLKGHKWTTMMIKRVYFGNWLRDYSQAVDVGSLKGVQAPTIRILVWILGFLSFGYATAEFEVTEERLGVYRPEEHIDNPKDYADNKDARTYDPRLRGPVSPVELEIDPSTGMKNYIANEKGGWATSTGYIKFSLERSIHFGRVYTNGRGNSGREDDLFEALRCMGQGLHCLEDFGAHTNYCELALIELGYNDVFPHTGPATKINLHGKQVYPLVTGTFGAVDFLHSVLGEASDHISQTEVDELDKALMSAEAASNQPGQRGLQSFVGLVGEIPGVGGGLADEARQLQDRSRSQEYENQRSRAVGGDQARFAVPGVSDDVDPVKLAAQIYPILVWRDRLVKAINNTIAKIPGLEALVERISETITLFVLSLLAPFLRPVINKISAGLKTGSSGVIGASTDQQFGPWNDVNCTDPTHSMLSKDHFSNYLNSCAGRVAATILQYAVPRILYAWENPGVPVNEVTSDILRAFHHPSVRNESLEIHRNMFNTVRKWVDENPERGNINHLLSSQSVKAGRNHKANAGDTHEHNLFRGLGDVPRGIGGDGANDEAPFGAGIWGNIQSRDLSAMNDPLSRAGSPMSGRLTPNFGYQNQGPGPGAGPPHDFLQPGGQATGYGGGYDQGPPQQQYGGGGYQQQQQPQYGQGPPGGFQQYGGPAGYPGGPPQPFPPGPGYPGGQQQGYGGQQTYGQPPPQQYGQPPYGGPPGGGYGGY